MYVGSGLVEEKEVSFNYPLISFTELTVDDIHVEVGDVSSVPDGKGEKRVVVYSQFKDEFLSFVCRTVQGESVVLFHLLDNEKDSWYSFLHSKFQDDECFVEHCSRLVNWENYFISEDNSYTGGRWLQGKEFSTNSTVFKVSFLASVFGLLAVCTWSVFKFVRNGFEFEIVLLISLLCFLVLKLGERTFSKSAAYYPVFPTKEFEQTHMSS